MKWKISRVPCLTTASRIIQKENALKHWRNNLKLAKQIPVAVSRLFGLQY
jgi:hypothetical protein